MHVHNYSECTSQYSHWMVTTYLIRRLRLIICLPCSKVGRLIIRKGFYGLPKLQHKSHVAVWWSLTSASYMYRRVNYHSNTQNYTHSKKSGSEEWRQQKSCDAVNIVPFKSVTDVRFIVILPQKQSKKINKNENNLLVSIMEEEEEG